MQNLHSSARTAAKTMFKRWGLIRQAKIATILMLAAGLYSCGNESVTHTKEEPFVIMKIEKSSDGKVIYSKGRYEHVGKEIFATGKQSITFDKDLGYKIGDTLCFKLCR